MDDPDDLRALGSKLDEIHRLREQKKALPPPTTGEITFRFATEMVVAAIVGGAMGWLLDRWLGTRPLFLIVLCLLGVVVGIRNVIAAAKEINARMLAAQDKKES
ncbi:MAG TPA: AtpZ/AtpI family protein [Rhizomicrobium sp.]|jgi:ATP synthase protein I